MSEEIFWKWCTCKWLHFLVLVGVVILLQPTGHSRLTRIEVIATSASEFNFSFTIRIVSSFGIEVCFTLSSNVSDVICSDSSTVMAHCLVVPLKNDYKFRSLNGKDLYLSSFHEQLIWTSRWLWPWLFARSTSDRI